MILRSLLFVPADSEKKLAKAKSSPADALILDLEDSIAPQNKLKARALAGEYLKGKHTQSIWVRINPVVGTDNLLELEEVAAAAPAGIVVPKACGPDTLRTLDRYLDRKSVV